MRKLERNEMKKLMGGLPAGGGGGSNVCVICGPGDVTCMASPNGWNCDYIDYYGLQCKNANESEEYTWSTFCCAGETGCHATSVPY